MTGQPFRHIVAVESVPASGRHVRLVPDEATRAALASFLEVLAIPSLTVDLELKLVHEGAVSVRGQLEASVVQTDVVTLEPVASDVAEEIDVVLRPAMEATRARPRASEGGEEEAAADEADVYRDDRIDLGALVGEHLALGLDPYPRAPGVAFEGHVEDDPQKDESPFAALAGLKRGED